MTPTPSSLEILVGRRIVVDTAGPVTFLGTLTEIRPDGLWLEDADLRDRSEGHDTKESYICAAIKDGIRANRRRIFVKDHVVISVSCLDDVVTD